MTDTENDEFNCLDNINDENLWSLFDKYAEKQTNETNETNELDRDKNNVINNCISCNSMSLIVDTSTSNYICTECGTINTEVFEQRPEWTNFEDGPKDNGRCGAPTNQFSQNLSIGTVISGGNSAMKRIQQWNSSSYKERSLNDVLKNIEVNMKRFIIKKNVIDEAKHLYFNISNIKHTDGYNKGKNIIIRGLNRLGLIAACAYYGAKLQGIPRSTKEIATIFGIKLTQVTKGCRKFLELNNYQSKTYTLHSSHAHDFIDRFGYKLKLKKNHIDIAIRIAENINKLDIASDHQPTSMAAGSILLTSYIYDLNIPKKEISEVFNISEVTITKAFKKIFPYKKILISNELTNIVLKKIQNKININCNTTNIITDDNNNSTNSNDDTVSQDNSDIKSNLSKIFIMPDDYNSDDLISGNTTLSSILTNSDTPNITISKINVNIEQISNNVVKRKRGRPRKIQNTNITDTPTGLNLPLNTNKNTIDF